MHGVSVTVHDVDAETARKAAGGRAAAAGQTAENNPDKSAAATALDAADFEHTGVPSLPTGQGSLTLQFGIDKVGWYANSRMCCCCHYLQLSVTLVLLFPRRHEQIVLNKT
jgi:hypothetical protein